MTQEARESAAVGQLAVFHRLVANTGVASVTNNFIWFAVTFWAYLETKSVLATAIIGGTYMLLLAGSALLFGTFVDRHRRKTSMLVSSAGSTGRLPGRGGVLRIGLRRRAVGSGQPNVLGFGCAHPGRGHRWQPPVGGTVHHGHPVGVGRSARQGQRAGGHGERHLLR